VIAVGIAAVGAPEAGAKPACMVGRWVAGTDLFAKLRARGEPSRAAATGETIIALDGLTASIPGVCPPTRVRFGQTRRKTTVRARWGDCEGVPGPVRLTGTIDSAGCRTFSGRVSGKRARRGRRFRAGAAPATASCDGSTLDQIQRRILGPRGCRVATCHGAAGAGGLDLRIGVAHLSLVDVPATNPAAAAAAKRRVVPGDPEASFLWQKLAGRLGAEEGSRMPPVGRALSALEMDVVRAWIAAGAPATGRVSAAPCLPPEQFHPAPALSPPTGGHQMVLEGPVLQPGEEIEGCVWVQVPNAEDFAVGEWEFSLNPGTHHFAVWEHVRGAPPELNVFKKEVACIASGAPVDGTTVAGAPEAPYFVQAYPAGIGQIVKGGSILGLNPHYHNEFDVPVQVKVWINMHPVTGPLRHVAETLVSTFAALDGKNPYSIFVPPFGTATLRLRYGPSDRPWSIFHLSSHQHQRGTRFTAWRSDGTKLFENFDWSHPAIFGFDPPFVLQPGDYIEYECEHDNGVERPVRRCGDSASDAGCTPGEPVPVTFGLTSVDEMCLLTGFYYTE
jgi:hypothetical protein